MKHIVFLVGSYYPYFSAVGRCIGNIVEELEESNRVTVVCFNTTTLQPPEERYRKHDIVRIFTKKMKNRHKLDELIKNETFFPGATIKTRIKLHQSWYFLKTLLSRESIDYDLVKAYVTTLDKLKRIDVLIPTCNPFDSVVAAMELKKHYPGIKIIPFLFDKFSESKTLHRTDWNQRLKMRNHLALEEKMISLSEKVLFVDTWNQYLRANFPQYHEKFYLIEHPLVKKFIIDKKFRLKNDAINVVYAGVLDKSMRSPYYTLRIFMDVFKINLKIILHMFILGNCNDFVDQCCIKSPGRIINYGSVKSIIARNYISESNILLSIGNSDFSVTPSKIFEYMSTGKPIIHFFKNKLDPVINILNNYPLSICLNQETDNFTENTLKVSEFININENKKIPFHTVESLFATAAPGFSANIISETLHNKIA